jgi:hypothetical protein
MLRNGDRVRCLDELDSILTLGAVYTVQVGQIDDGLMISLEGFEGAFSAARFELVESIDAAAVKDIAKRREASIKACVNESLTRAGGAAMNVVKRAHALVAALRNHGIDNFEMLERSERLPERTYGAILAVESIVDELGLAGIVDRNAGCFDREQLEHDVKNKVTQVLRELL